MESFKSKYPAFTALLVIVGGALAKAVAPAEGLLQKLSSEMALAPKVLAFAVSGQAAGLGAELALLKESVTDMEAGLEVLVTELALSSDKAKAILPHAFAVGEWAASGVAPIKGLVEAIEA